MKPECFQAKTLKMLINKHKIVTLDQLKHALGTQTTMTVVRKLRELSYRTSYTHRGKYYTMDATAQFDKYGLWVYKDVRFSIYGTLLETIKSFVNTSINGYNSQELKSILHVEVKEP